MPTPYEAALLRENVTLKLTAVARDMGALPHAAADIARRLAEAGAEIRPDGRVRLASGESIAGAIETMRRLECPEYFTASPVPTTPEVKPEPTTTAGRRKRATDRLSRANRDHPERPEGDSE